MNRVASANFQKNKKILLAQNAQCRLCNRYGALEIHHIIPASCGGSDDIGNLIVICEECHTKLTPRSELTKIGLKNLKQKNCGEIRAIAEILKRIESEEDSHLTSADVVDIIIDYEKELLDKGDFV